RPARGNAPREARPRFYGTRGIELHYGAEPHGHAHSGPGRQPRVARFRGGSGGSINRHRTEGSREMKFDGKAGIVTGAGSGIGRATAMGFAKRGANVAVVDINREGA